MQNLTEITAEKIIESFVYKKTVDNSTLITLPFNGNITEVVMDDLFKIKCKKQGFNYNKLSQLFIFLEQYKEKILYTSAKNIIIFNYNCPMICLKNTNESSDASDIDLVIHLNYIDSILKVKEEIDYVGISTGLACLSLLLLLVFSKIF